MKKIIILLLFSLSVVAMRAQNCDSVAQSIVAKIKGYSPDDLLPYYDKESDKWGIMSKDGKILTQAIAPYPHYVIFNPNLEWTIYEGINCSITILGRDYSYKVEGTIEVFAVAMHDADINPNISSNIKGFKVDEREEISEHSNQYERVAFPFKYNEKWYAYAKLAKNNKWGVIDEDGDILVDFKYKSLDFIKNYNDKSQCWFYFENEEEKRGFINIEGQTKLYGELLFPIFISQTYNSYNIQEDEEKSGILDLRTLEWTIKPQEKLKFEEVISIGQDTENLTYYVVVADGDEKYVIDMNQKAYKPKK